MTHLGGYNCFVCRYFHAISCVWQTAQYCNLPMNHHKEKRSELDGKQDVKDSPSLFTYHTHDEFGSANPSSMQDAYHI